MFPNRAKIVDGPTSDCEHCWSANMNVLFLGEEGNLQPWFDDFCEAVGEAHQIILFDPKQSLEAQFRGIDVIVDQGGSVGTQEMIDSSVRGGVKFWQILGTGLDHVDIDYFKFKQMRVCHLPGEFSAVALAEHAIFLMLNIYKNATLARRNILNGVLCRPMNEELAGKTVGIIGLGASGKELARRVWSFGM